MASTTAVSCSLLTPPPKPSDSSPKFPFPPPLNFAVHPLSEFSTRYQLRFSSRRRLRLFAQNSSFDEDAEESEATIEDLRVPDHWLDHSRAREEAEWLRITLHKWLDDEYCPEPTNIEISKAASESYHQSLLNKTTDLGEILLEMVRELETISYQESFHGAFSSANAAISLIAQRIEAE